MTATASDEGPGLRGESESWALGPGAVAVAGGHFAVAGALVLVARGARRHAVAAGAADPAVLEAVVVPARLGAPHPALAVAERCPKSKVRNKKLDRVNTKNE